MSFYNAKKQFEDNLKFFGDPHKTPEQFNLYHGLANMAQAFISLERRINQIEHKISAINLHLQQIRH